MSKHDYPTLLITGTIQVDSNMPFVAVNNVEERKEAYLNTVLWAIASTPFQRIVFCENSGFELDCSYLRSSATESNKEFEYLAFTGNKKKAIEQGKGYGEGEIISYALENSELIKKSDMFCKITGRVTIQNIERCIKGKRNYFMHVEGEKKIDTRFYCIRIDDYNSFLRHAYIDVNDKNGKYLEHVFYEKIKSSGFKYRSFYALPWIKGISGSTGMHYDSNRTEKSRKRVDWLCRMNLYNLSIIWEARKKLALIRSR